MSVENLSVENVSWYPFSPWGGGVSLFTLQLCSYNLGLDFLHNRYLGTWLQFLIHLLVSFVLVFYAYLIALKLCQIDIDRIWSLSSENTNPTICG